MNKILKRFLIMFVLATAVVSASAETINESNEAKKTQEKYVLNNKIYLNRLHNLFKEDELIQIEKNDTNIVLSSQIAESDNKKIHSKEKKKQNTSKKKNNISKKNDNKNSNKNDVYFKLSEEERRIAECIVMGEAGNESYKGQVLVAQCILNACLKDNANPSTIRAKYKYSGWNTNPNKSVKKAVREVFDKGHKVTNEYILYFYAPKYCTSNWHESQRYVLTEGGHRFFAEN